MCCISIKDCHGCEFVNSASFCQCNVDDLWINANVERSKYFVVSNVNRHRNNEFILFIFMCFLFENVSLSRVFSFLLCGGNYEHSDPDYVNKVINKVDKWLCSNRLFISYTKTNFLLFNRTSP